ncbi:MAG: peptigoglycan-binding protein LysM [Pseudomonadota bacterium]
MSKLAAFLSANSGVTAVAAVAAVGVVGGTAYLASQRPEPAPVVQAALPAPDPAPVATVAPAVTPQPDAPEPEVALIPPSIDEVRLQDGGILVVAGRALAGSTVAIFVDGAANAEATTGRDGAFAAVSFVEASPNPRVLSIVQRSAAGEIAGLEEVILAPLPQPQPQPAPKVAEAVLPETVVEPAPEPEPQPETVAEVAPVPESVAEVTPQPEPASETVAEVAPKPEPEPKPVVEVAPETEPETVAEVAPEPEPETVAEVAPQPETEPETVAEVAAPAAPETPERVAILRSDPAGVSLSNPGPGPQVMDQVALDTISYNNLGEVQLSGRAQPEAEVVRVYLDNRAVAELTVDANGNWRGDLPNIDTGVYTLRIDEVKETGAVVSRVETPFKREDPAVLDAATDPGVPAQAITVQAGATLWAIARDRYGEGRAFVRVFEANRESIRDPDLIYPGQVFALPN